MEMTFLGGASEVGKSCLCLTSGSTTIYIDCGLKMEKEATQLPAIHRGKRPSAVLLSHAHLDHCGAIPNLYKHGAPITYCTTPAIEVCEVLYKDTLKIAKEEKLPAPFSESDLKKAMQYFSALGYGNEFKISSDFKFSFIDAGHIIGAAQVQIITKDKKMVYTGDFKLKETRMHSGAQIPENVDILIIESTYGGKAQPLRAHVENKFFTDVNKIVENNETALIPCFAIGRTQEIIALLSEKKFKGGIYLDGMGKKVNDIYYNYASYLRDGKNFRNSLKKVKTITDKFERKEALQGGNAIICTAGMLEGGPILGYIQEMEKNGINGKIFLTGFQVPGSNGHKMLEGKPITLKGRKTSELKVALPFELYEFSAHSDQEELLEYVKKVNPEKVICVHGDNTQSFAELLKQRGFDACAPKNEERIKIE